jgi:hypothetical protein
VRSPSTVEKHQMHQIDLDHGGNCDGGMYLAALRECVKYRWGAVGEGEFERGEVTCASKGGDRV